VGNETSIRNLARAITKLEETNASDLIPDVEVLCDLKDRLVILAQECSSRTADAQAVARKRVREAVDGITVDVRDLRALGVSK
jgi:hypothetical protein